ncbi:hypothetical protein NQ314_018487 [Rhamnusium bicolor]|uniref:GCS light chain n=1 Tax=Rhamnusium bicolor TaxID=1586634 RepID=A0AAV8WRX5_9CUCU|nr:hypothetical protein NQ314_018487 [Rhamnusium bicolor]
MAKHNLENVENVIINTGNILSINDITKKPNQNPTEELVEAINITIKDFQNGSALNPQPDHLLVVNRTSDDLLTKINEHERSELKIGFKIFLNNDDQKLVQEAVEKRIADIEENTFRALFDWAEVKPNIIQINLATCCVVPPTLQTFCKENDVKLLTHSDNSDILPKKSIEDIFGKPLSLKWALRFLIHVKCRGVLITKGYLLNFAKD